MKDRNDGTFRESEDVASYTECTGLMPALPWTTEENINLSKLYSIHSGKVKRRKKRKE